MLKLEREPMSPRGIGLSLSTRVLIVCLAGSLPSLAHAQAGPPPSPPTGRGSLWLSTVKQDGLLPVACFDSVKKEWNAEACLNVAPAGSQFASIPDGAPLVLGKRKNLKLAFCDQDEANRVPVRSITPRTKTRYAVWPRELASTVRWSPPLSKPSEAEKQWMKKLLPKNKLSFEKTLRLDLDGDGVEDQLHLVWVKDAEDEADEGYQQIFFHRGNNPGASTVLMKQGGMPRSKYQFVATMDLNGDHRPEVLIEWASDAGSGGEGALLFSLEKGEVVNVGEWSCESEY